MPLRAVAWINVAAIERNVEVLRRRLRGGAELCAVVKADGYGHGAAAAAHAALAGGATWLAVATADEAARLRAADLPDVPILVLGALSADELPVALRAGADLVVWNEAFVAAVSSAAYKAGRRQVRLHVKLDTGLGRLGAREPAEAMGVVDAIAMHGQRLVLAGAMTHLATADDDPTFLDAQLTRARPFLQAIRRRHPQILVHVANSAAVLNAPHTHFDLVRCGIAIYGCDPMGDNAARHGLEPALELSSYVARVAPTHPGDSVGYGRRFVSERDTWIGTLPIGYGDGIRRALTNNCDVLIDGRRYPLVGTVSMDNITIDLGPSPTARVGDRAMIIGRSGRDQQTAEELARRLETISYEIVSGITSRVPRRLQHDGIPVH